MMKTLAGKVCLVTGATRGIGRGIALQLGEAGATVYITGRTLNAPKGRVGGCLTETKQEIEKRGGNCVAVQCDHSKDEEIQKLFEQIKREQDGRLDVLVNNAYSGVNSIFGSMEKKFWEVEPTMWDDINNVGLRNHYICSVYAARMMVERKSGLIINISSAGGMRYIFNVPYGIGKAACDRMAADCAVELKKYNVAFVSLWPGAVNTEIVNDLLVNEKAHPKYAYFSKIFVNGESTEYSGKCVVKLAEDPNIMKRTGRILLTPEIGAEYGFKDIDGKVIKSFRQLNVLLPVYGPAWLASYIPDFIKIPYWMLTLGSSKF